MLRINNETMPSVSGEPTKQPRVTITEWETPQNNLNVQKLGPLKFDWAFSFDKLERFEYEKVVQYIFAGTDLRVQYQVGGVMVLDQFCYIVMGPSSIQLNSLYSFSIVAKAI